MLPVILFGTRNQVLSMKRVVAVLWLGLVTLPAFSMDRAAYCDLIGNRYAYVAKLRDAGKTQQEVLTVVQPVYTDKDDTPVLKNAAIQMHRAYVKLVYDRLAVQTPGEVYTAFNDGCMGAAKEH